jgi:folate-binding protein YgfZ
MNLEAYQTVRADADGCAFILRNRGFLAVAGLDRRSYLQGQVSNDVQGLPPGQALKACLLNNTGHLLADLIVYALQDQMLIETDARRTAVVQGALNRYIVRERVEVVDVSDHYSALRLAGAGALSFSATAIEAETNVLVRRDASVANLFLVDLIAPPERIGRYVQSLCTAGALPLDDAAYEAIRVESGLLQWGAELDEKVIPLEAGMEDSLSYSKGCYMGQEIIARIHSRGHTNRSLCGVAFSSEPAGADLAADSESGPQPAGRMTSVVQSPILGWIGLGYLRSAFALAGTTVKCGEALGTVSTLPLVFPK